MKGVVENSGSSKKAEMLVAIEQMTKPNPEQQAAQAQMQQLQMAEQLAKVKKLEAEAEKAAVEAKIAPTVAQAKVIAALSNNLDDDAEGKDFERRVRLAELLLQEKDIDSNREIAQLQMQKKAETE
jgi:ATPase subunit of ABC transporter with duplicated ATPase domains